MDVKIVRPYDCGGDISINNGQISNDIIINGSGNTFGAIITGRDNHVVNISNNSSIDWNGLQSDLQALNGMISDLAEGQKKSDLQATSASLQNAVNTKNESAVWSTLKRAAKGTLDFIKTLSLQVLPSLILKKFG